MRLFSSLGRWSLALTVLLPAISFERGTAIAQQMLEVPAPSSQSQPPAAPKPRRKRKPAIRPTPTPAPQSEETIEEEETIERRGTIERPEPETEIPEARVQPLPRIFRGCWDGEVARVDSIRRLPGAHPIGPWTPKTYRLCYQRVGDGPFRLTFSDVGVAPNRLITNPEGNVRVESTDGHSYAVFRAELHFDERHALRPFSTGTFGVDETTDLNCRIERDAMLVSARVYGLRQGEPWFEATWRAAFRHVGD